MKRKVIQIADSTQLISLPRKWAQQYNIKKGDELEIEEKGSKITISTDKTTELEKIETDISNLDRTSIIFVIRSAYKMGYDEIHLKFSNQLTKHYRTNEKEKVISIVHEELNRLTGMEVVQQRENFCIIKSLSSISEKEFDTALRRVFLLLTDMSKDLLQGIKNDDKVLMETIEEKHDTITKFITFCLRILNKKGYSDSKKSMAMYHIISNLDLVVDVIKYGARDYASVKKKFSKESITLIESVNKSIHDYYEFFYKFDLNHVSLLYKNRDSVLRQFKKMTNKLPEEEMLFIDKLTAILEIIKDLIECRVGIEY